ncbi:MAG TPA: tannase/feruloyl esterase family alpha/beta hydrolase [Bryobacteraceae bacterium]|nr:tannase/feruloyl esterase family alpha/beta hydrolase [Bryobacteraceae bacterium]
MRLLIGTMLCAASAWGQGAGNVQFRDWGAQAVGPQPKIACAQLRSLTSYELSVISANVVAATEKAPEHCRVSVLVAPEIHIEVNLPAAWNSRLYMFGNGGFAGESFEAPNRVNNRAAGLRNGFTTAATDTGHSAATEPVATFAANQQKLIDFGFRSLHMTAVVAKLLINAYFGQPPSKSYYDGCSLGGRQGLILAQRFPEDFDAILAGAPALDQTGTMLSRAWWMQGIAETPIPAFKLKMLSEKVYEQCDAKDGLKDGLIDDPRKCGFKASRDLPTCASGVDQPDCFTTGQIAVLERIYGDVMSQGKRFFPGYPVGTEVAGPTGQSAWVGQVVNGANGPGVWTRYAETFLQFEAFPEKDPKLPLSRFDIDKDVPRTTLAAQILNATDTDLSAFQRHGGKLLMYFGWADPQLNPLMGVEYYEKVLEKSGGATSDFFRLFMVPGMFHCGGGIGTSVFDAATPLLKWAELGAAPDQITGSRVVDGKVVRTRPLCSYPQVARYKGSGSIDDATNFSCVRP